MTDGNFDAELAAARSAVEELACAGELPAGVTSTLGDIIRLIDALATSMNTVCYRLESEVDALTTDAHRLQAEVHRLEDTASAANAEWQSLRTRMRGFDRLEKKPDQVP